jgi:ketosteroid isomerase-like protein
MDYAKAIRDAYAGFAEGNPAPLFGMMDPKIEWIEAAGYPYAGTYVGPDAVGSGVFARLAADWDPYTVECDHIIADADSAASVGTYRGTNKATGKSFEARFVHVWHFRDDRLIKLEQVVDSAKVNEAL